MCQVIVAGGPIRNRAWCVRDHVLAIDAAAQEADVDLCYCYVLGDSDDGTDEALLDAVRLTKRKYYLVARHDPDGVGCCRTGNQRYSLHNLAQARQLWVDIAIANDPTHLWSVDSDIIVHPSSLSLLLAANTNMAGARVNLSEHNPNIYNVMTYWENDNNQPYRDGQEFKLADYLHSVPATWVGACVLYDNAVFSDLGCKFFDDDIVSTHPLRMEELSIVRRLRANNIKPMWVPAARTTHLMTIPA